MSEQTTIPGTEVKPSVYATRLESMKGTLTGVETDLGSQHTALGLVASELLRGEPIEMTEEQRAQFVDVLTAVDEMLNGIRKICAGMKKDLAGLRYGYRVRFSPGMPEESA